MIEIYLKKIITCIGDYNLLNKYAEFSNKSIFLVTGGAGFIGSNLCESLLNKGYNVICLDNFSTGNKNNIIEFINHPKFLLIEGDIRDLNTCINACKNVDYVLHQAAWGSVPRSIEMPLLYDEINVKGTLNMLEAARINNVSKFVYASSSSVYGDSLELPKCEGVEGKILSPYALTKRINEDYASLYTKLYGLETYGLRYFNVFGKRQDPNGPYAAVIPKFIKCLICGKAPIIYGDGNQSRDFTYIENVIQANLIACLSPTRFAGQSFNIAYGGQETLLTMLAILKKYLNVNIEPTFESERLGDIKHSNADISKAKKMLGYFPEYSFAQGIEHTINWYKNNSVK